MRQSLLFWWGAEMDGCQACHATKGADDTRATVAAKPVTSPLNNDQSGGTDILKYTGVSDRLKNIATL